jgi:glycosyltransferase involved in cell wall biosynthesis
MLKAIWERCCQPVAPKRLVLQLTSDAERRESLERFPASETIVIPEGVEIPDEVTYASADGALCLAFLGRLDPKKGIENLFHACCVLNGISSRNWSLTLAGAGDPYYTEALRALRDDLALSQQVVLVGEVTREAKRKFFEDVDILVVPSYTENFGMVVAEALAHGVPVIASKGTPWERLEEMGCGLWVDNDPKSLADAIARMSRMPLRDMGLRGRRWMEEEFAWPFVAQQMVQLYQCLMVPSS